MHKGTDQPWGCASECHLALGHVAQYEAMMSMKSPSVHIPNVSRHYFVIPRVSTVSFAALIDGFIVSCGLGLLLGTASPSMMAHSMCVAVACAVGVVLSSCDGAQVPHVTLGRLHCEYRLTCNEAVQCLSTCTHTTFLKGI